MWRQRQPAAVEKPLAPSPRLVTVQTEGGTVQVTLHPLASSMLESAGHDAGAEMLVIVYHARATDGTEVAPVVRVYNGVKTGIFQGLLAAQSPGTFFQQFIWDRYQSLPGTFTD